MKLRSSFMRPRAPYYRAPHARETSPCRSIALGALINSETESRLSRAQFVRVAVERPSEVLEQVARLPIATWNYLSQDRAIRHMGPMAQDLHAALGLGESDKHIATIDADGVALAAIQGLTRSSKRSAPRRMPRSRRCGPSLPQSVRRS